MGERKNSNLIGADTIQNLIGEARGQHSTGIERLEAFLRGTSLRPVPPGESKSKDTRYFDIHEDDQLDEAQLAGWVKHASQLPGEDL